VRHACASRTGAVPAALSVPERIAAAVPADCRQEGLGAMLVFETILALLFAATILSMVAPRANVPYPTLLALAGPLVTLVPGTPGLDLPPGARLAEAERAAEPLVATTGGRLDH
jgi:hypothetical protein